MHIILRIAISFFRDTKCKIFLCVGC